jgi:ribosomal protein S2
MKITKFKFKQILKLHLLNSRAYEYATQKVNSSFLTDFSLTQVIGDFKKALYIIFKYHKANKRVLFVGVPKKLEEKINRRTHHIAVDPNFELQGVISNNLSSSKFGKLVKHSFSKISIKSLIPKLTKKPDLVVIFSHEKKQSLILESNIAKVPVIIFESTKFPITRDSNNLYTVGSLGENLRSISERSLLVSGLNFLFKKAK